MYEQQYVLIEILVLLLYFNYKSQLDSFVYKKKTNWLKVLIQTVEKDDEFNPPQEMMDEGEFERVEKRIDVWYEGVMVMGTNIMLEWENAGRIWLGLHSAKSICYA